MSFESVTMLGKYIVEFDGRDGRWLLNVQAVDHTEAIRIASREMHEACDIFGFAPHTFTRCTLVRFAGGAR